MSGCASIASGETVSRSTSFSRFTAMFHCCSVEIHQRFGQPRDGRAHSAVLADSPLPWVGRTSLSAAEGRVRACSVPARLFALVGDHDLERRSALSFPVGRLEIHLTVVSDVRSSYASAMYRPSRLSVSSVPGGGFPSRVILHRIQRSSGSAMRDRRVFGQFVEILFLGCGVLF